MTPRPGRAARRPDRAVTDGTSHQVGWFRFYFADQRWEWAEQVQRMHGYEPGTVSPTTELVLAHKYADDRDQVAATIEQVVNNRRPFSTRHRIVDTAGAVHHVVVAGDRLCDDDGEVIGTHGFYIDVSPMPGAEVQDIISAKVAEITERRAAIEQTKGMLMLVYGIDDDAAFDLLRVSPLGWWGFGSGGTGPVRKNSVGRVGAGWGGPSRSGQ